MDLRTKACQARTHAFGPPLRDDSGAAEKYASIVIAVAYSAHAGTIVVSGGE